METLKREGAKNMCLLKRKMVYGSLQHRLMCSLGYYIVIFEDLLMRNEKSNKTTLLNILQRCNMEPYGGEYKENVSWSVM